MSVFIIVNIWFFINLLNCMEVELDFCVISKVIIWNFVSNMVLYLIVKFFYFGKSKFKFFILFLLYILGMFIFMFRCFNL